MESITITHEDAKAIQASIDEVKERAADKLNGSPMKVAREQLKSIIERIERMEEEKASIADDIKDIYAEARGNGLT